MRIGSYVYTLNYNLPKPSAIMGGAVTREETFKRLEVDWGYYAALDGLDATQFHVEFQGVCGNCQGQGRFSIRHKRTGRILRFKDCQECHSEPYVTEFEATGSEVWNHAPSEEVIAS